MESYHRILQGIVELLQKYLLIFKSADGVLGTQTLKRQLQIPNYSHDQHLHLIYSLPKVSLFHYLHQTGATGIQNSHPCIYVIYFFFKYIYIYSLFYKFDVSYLYTLTRHIMKEEFHEKLIFRL